MRPRSSTLFHFTRSLAALKSILNTGFWPRYCLEDISWVRFEQYDAMAFPMVCFCDIPLSRIADHVQTYGEYGVGLTKTWALDQGLNPILYVGESASVSQSLQALMQPSLLLEGDAQVKFSESFRHLHAFIKPLTGRTFRNELAPTKDFYQESEWRYVPRHPQVREFLHRAEYEQEILLEASNDHARVHASLKFDPADIRYIFTSTDEEIPELIAEIGLLAYPEKDRQVLLSRVTSVESIRLDT